jgi:uncharacterized membrane-anchored protein YhcB (DUF1043 family)
MANFVMTWIFPALCLLGGVLIGQLMIEVAKWQDENWEEKKKRENRE